MLHLILNPHSTTYCTAWPAQLVESLTAK